MKTAAGFLVSEIVTYVLIALVLMAVAFGMFVSAERDGMVELAQASIEKIKQSFEAATSKGQPVVCNDTLVSSELLANDFLSLSIKPILKDPEDIDAGYAPGLHVRSEKEEDGSDVFVTAKRLFEAVKNDDEKRLREFYNEDDRIEYFVLISDQVRCIDLSQVASNDKAGG